MPNNIVVDADAHIPEPLDLWDKYLEQRYKAHGIRWKTKEEGLEYLEIDGKPRVGQRFGANASLGGIGGYPDKDGDRTKLLTPGLCHLGAPKRSSSPW